MLLTKYIKCKLHYDYVICGGASVGLALANKISLKIIKINK